MGGVSKWVSNTVNKATDWAGDKYYDMIGVDLDAQKQAAELAAQQLALQQQQYEDSLALQQEQLEAQELANAELKAQSDAQEAESSAVRNYELNKLKSQQGVSGTNLTGEQSLLNSIMEETKKNKLGL